MTTKFSQKLQDFEVTFDDEGNLTESNWIDTYRARGSFIVKRNSFFYDKIEFVKIIQTHSGKSKFVFKSLINECLYYMIIGDFADILQEDLINHKVVEGIFSFRKAGEKQGIRFVKP